MVVVGQDDAETTPLGGRFERLTYDIMEVR